VTDQGDFRSEVERKLGRTFSDVQAQLEEMFDREWDEIAVVIETRAMKTDLSHADVIVELVERFDRKPAPQQRVKRSLIRWIGKPWRERENPWDRFKDKVPPVPPRTDAKPGDLDEWTPLKPEED
jgi:hypothetical protein